MKLAEFIEREGITQAAFARRLGVSPAHLSRILSGERFPNFTLAGLIARETGGAVPLEVWVDEHRRVRPSVGPEASCLSDNSGHPPDSVQPVPSVRDESAA